MSVVEISEVFNILEMISEFFILQFLKYFSYQHILPPVEQVSLDELRKKNINKMICVSAQRKGPTVGILKR